MRGALDDVAGVVGGLVSKRFGSAREAHLRNRLMAAGLYTTAPRKFIGYQTKFPHCSHRPSVLRNHMQMAV